MIRLPGSTLALALLLAPIITKAESPAPEPDARGPALELSRREFTQLAARFDEKMAAALPADRIAAVWDGLVGQAGAWQAAGEPRWSETGGYRVALVRLDFEKASFDLRLLFGGDGKVAGLFIVPPSGDAPAPEWTAPGYANPEAFTETELPLASGRYTLPGRLTLPRRDRPAPVAAVVLVHGSGLNDEDETIGPSKPFRDLAWGLASRGVAVFRYRKRTLVYAAELRRDDAGLTVREETIDDARAAVKLLAARAEIDRRRIFVLGHSLGAMLAPRIAEGNPDVRGIVLLAGNSRPLETLIAEQVRTIARLDGSVSAEETAMIEAADRAVKAIRNPALKAADMVEVLGSKTPGSYWLDLRGYDPAATAAGLTLPVLVLQGGRDYQVREADLEGWRKALAKRPQASFKVYPELNHLFAPGEGPSSPVEYEKLGHVDARVVADVASWIASLPAPARAAGAAGETKPRH